MYTNPVWLCITYLCGRISQRTRAALDGNPESGALSLEWVVIATLLTIAAVAVGLFLTGVITKWEGQVKTGP